MRWWGDLFERENHQVKPPNQVISAAWEDEGTAWMIYELEETVFNTDLSSYIHRRGP
jgi:hypothetical protein